MNLLANSSDTISTLSRRKLLSKLFQNGPNVTRGSVQALSRQAQVYNVSEKVGDSRKPTSLPINRNWDLAGRVKYVDKLLSEGKREKALEFAVQHSKDRQLKPEGLWNQIIKDDMRHGHAARAFKLYNDMKKRALPPNSYTYTHLFDGLAKNTSSPQAVQRAESLYTSMLGDKSAVKPSIIHTNAALHVCTEAGDVDALFRIASSLPTEGPGAPDSVTFDSVIQGLLQYGMKSGSWQRAIMLGRRVWQDVISRWQDGLLTLDARLVHSMSRLLSFGSNKDVDDIFSLIEQTTGQKRLFPPIGDPGRKSHLELYRRPSENEDDSASGQITNTSSEIDDGQEAVGSDALDETQSVFDPLTPSADLQYVQPNNALLSRVIRECMRFHARAEAQMYWGLLTSKLEPDFQNYMDYLRLLRQSHASTLATELVANMLLPQERGGLGMQVTPMTFAIAMESCKHDHRNDSSVRNALSILSMAKQKFYRADLRTLHSFAALLDLRKRNLREIDPIFEALNAVFLGIRSEFAYGPTVQPNGSRDFDHRQAVRSKDTGQHKTGAELEEMKAIVGLTSKTIEGLVRSFAPELSPRRVREVKDMRMKQVAWLRRLEVGEKPSQGSGDSQS